MLLFINKLATGQFTIVNMRSMFIKNELDSYLCDDIINIILDYYFNDLFRENIKYMNCESLKESSNKYKGGEFTSVIKFCHREIIRKRKKFLKKINLKSEENDWNKFYKQCNEN